MVLPLEGMHGETLSLSLFLSVKVLWCILNTIPFFPLSLSLLQSLFDSITYQFLPSCLVYFRTRINATIHE